MSSPPPPLSPVLAPKGQSHRKRRHSQLTAESPTSPPRARKVGTAAADVRTGSGISGATENGFEHESPAARSTAESRDDALDSDVDHDHVRDVLDEARNGDDGALDASEVSLTSSIEDCLDNAEVNPYRPFFEGDQGLSPEASLRLRDRLIDIGPHQFFEETLEKRNINPRLLGTAFGIDPRVTFPEDDEKYMRVLLLAVMRTFTKRRKLSQYNTIDDAAKLLRDSKRILVITGAGISTSLGIPDFRSKEGGFYTMLLQEGYDDPEAVFDIETFDMDPRLFYKLAGNILPDMRRFSPTHAFIRLLQDKGQLQRNYTQNIDALEQAAGIRDELLVQCHGSFATATCRKDRSHRVKGTEIFDDIRAQRVAYCKRCKQELALKAQMQQRDKSTQRNGKKRRDDFSDDSDEDDDFGPGVMKPDITFFGEKLPDHFFDRLTEQDVKDVDLIIVIGTSLKVSPVADIPDYLPNSAPLVYISREPIEHINFDIQLLGNCDDIVFELCRRAGWTLKHDMIPAGFRVSVQPHGDGNDGSRWRIISRTPTPVPGAAEKEGKKSTSQSSHLNVPRGSSPFKPRAVSPAHSVKSTASSALNPRSRTSSPAQSSKGTNSTSLHPHPTTTQRALSPSRPAFRPIPGSPVRRPTSTPPPNRQTTSQKQHHQQPSSSSSSSQQQQNQRQAQQQSQSQQHIKPHRFPIPGSPIRRPTSTPPPAKNQYTHRPAPVIGSPQVQQKTKLGVGSPAEPTKLTPGSSTAKVVVARPDDELKGQGS